MAFRAPSDGDPAGRRRWLVIAGVSALVLLDVILVVWVVSRPDVSEAGSTSPVPSVSAEGSPTPAPSTGAENEGEGEGEPTGVAPADSVATTRILTAIDGDRAWRATTGACPDAAASPEYTTDAGATWNATDATGPTGVTALQRIIASSTEVATMVGAGADGCAPTLIRTYVRGDNYEDYPAEVGTAWHIDPADRARVVAPAGAVDGPCADGAGALAVAPSNDESAAVLCSDGTISTTTDAGAAWSTPVAVAGAQALTTTEGGFLVARLGGSACAGLGLVIVDADGALVGDSGCLPLSGDLTALAGQVAVSDGGGTWWAWVGESLVRSGDRGATWG